MLHVMADTAGYEPTAREAAVLAAAMREWMAAAGELGGKIAADITGLREPASRKGGAAGGRWGARFTRSCSAEALVEVSQEAAVVRERGEACISAEGTVIEDPNGTGDESIWGLVGSGVMNMVPALVRVDVEAIGSGTSRVHVRATGREGLIRQQVAAKAVDRIAEAICRESGVPSCGGGHAAAE